MKHMRKWIMKCIYFTMLLLGFSCDKIHDFLPWNQKEKEVNDSMVYYRIKWVSDGDTFWIEDGSEHGQKIRLIGIDANESIDYGDKLKEKFGEEAHHFVDSMLKGKKVRLTYDVIKYDKYGRTLAYAFLEDGTLVNQKIVSYGYAHAFNYAPNLRYANEFVAAEDSAYENRLGLWAD